MTTFNKIHKELTALADKWLASARQSYINEERLKEKSLEDRPTGKEVLEFAARREIYCAIQLKEALSSLLLSSSQIPKKMKSNKKPRT